MKRASQRKQEDKIIGSIFDSILESSDKAAEERFGDLAKSLRDSEQYKSPDLYNILVSYQLQQLLEMVIKNKVVSGMSADGVFPNRNNLYKIEFLYTNFAFIEHHFEETMRMTHGSACCVDRAHWVINRLLKLLMENHDFTKDSGDSLKATNEFYIPRVFDSINDWFKYLEALSSLYYGDLTKFLVFYKDSLIPAVSAFKANESK